MDVFQNIREKSQLFSDSQYFDGIVAVLLHLQIAEKHLVHGTSTGEDYYFTDVVYRTNHAFEGILKEAYTLFTGKDEQQPTPFQIEKYLLDNKLLKERVLALFTNYRTEWRNKSTHDYQLFFSEQEAFLAITTVSAFISILLDQMVEKMAFERKTTDVAQNAPAIRSAIPDYEALAPFDQVLQILLRFSSEFQVDENQSSPSFESELVGELSGYIKAVAPQIVVESDTTITAGRYQFAVDLLLCNRGESILLELKRPGSGLATMRSGREQLFSYLSASDVDKGILLVLPFREGTPMTVDTVTRLHGGTQKQVTTVYPSMPEEQSSMHTALTNSADLSQLATPTE